MERLFIYGTLAPGRPNEHKLSDISGDWQEATVKGALELEGWGAEMGYPGIILDEKAQEVEGFVFTSSELYKKWEELDNFEGADYSRVVAKATLSSGEVVEAYVYALNKEV